MGCPAGWDRNAREDYRAIFEAAGYPPVRVVSESRAALVSACQSRHLQVGHDILSKPVLVVDIGSSTTDFAYVCHGREVEMRTAGEVSLGGGIMDEILLHECVARSENSALIEEIFEKSPAWKSYCEFAGRRLKESYYSKPDGRRSPEVSAILIRYGKPVTLKLVMDEEMARLLTEEKSARLGGRSFRESFLMALEDVKRGIPGEMPELIFLTGGVSRLADVKKWCGEVFPEAVMISSLEPEFSVARGLAWSGRIDDDLRDFRAEIKQFNESDTVEDIVARRIDSLYRDTVDALVEPILHNAAEPVFDRWRSGELERLADADEELQREITAYLKSDEVRELLVEPISAWLKGVADEIENYTVPICVKHRVPYTALSLSSYLDTSDIDISLNVRNLFAVEEITLLIDSVISIVIGLICGGSGIALISAGPNGIIAGVLVSLVVLILGKKRMEKAILTAKVPRPLRKLVSKSTFNMRIGEISGEVRGDLMKSLLEEKNEEITGRMVGEISDQIEECLTKMAAVVEIPLG